MADFECIVRDIPGAEGPLVTLEGRIFMVGPDEGRIIEVLGKDATRDLARYDGIPAGLQLDRHGDIWIADMKRGIFRITQAGNLIEEVTQFDGKPIRGCNDCYFDSGQNLYFTAPAGSGPGKAEGEVYCRLADGEVRRLDQGYEFSNGLAVSADDSLLIVAETFTKQLWAFDIDSPGVVSNKREWGRLPGDHKGGPDGIDFDADGHMLATNWGGAAVEVFDPAGKHVDRIELPFKHPSNVHFIGPDSNELLITEHTTHGLWKTTWRTTGQVQDGWKKN